MNAAQLLAHFDRISEAPDAIPRLRRFILDLAVRGKLVEQDPEDEPAATLLGDRQFLPGPGSEPWRLPAGWAWSSYRLIGETIGGGTPSKASPEFWNGSIPWVSPKDMKVDFIEDAQDHISEMAIEQSSARLVPAGSLLMVVRGMILAHSFPVAIAVVPVTINQDMKAVVPFRADLGTTLLLISKGMKPEVSRLVLRSTHGTCKLLTDDLFLLPLPIPPLAEQHRIVAKLDELMALCDRLEAAQADRERRRGRLAAASLQRLNQPTAAAGAPAFRDHARFHLAHLPRLTTRPDQIPALRQTILNLAVRGQLVPQDPGDEPASELLRRIHTVKTSLVKQGALVRPSPAPGDSRELALEHPDGWVTPSLGEVCSLVTSGSRGWAEYYTETGPKFIRAQNLRFGRLRLDDLACVTPPKRTEGTRTQVAKGDLLIVITGAGVTNPALLDVDLGEAYVSQHVALIRPTSKDLSHWLLLCLMAPAGGRSELVARAYGAGKPGLNLDNIRCLQMPLPPLAEQHRIIAKVERLMALCDRLEAQLTAGQVESRRLLEALLHQALAPVAWRRRAVPTTKEESGSRADGALQANHS